MKKPFVKQVIQFTNPQLSAVVFSIMPKAADFWTDFIDQNNNHYDVHYDENSGKIKVYEFEYASLGRKSPIHVQDISQEEAKTPSLYSIGLVFMIVALLFLSPIPAAGIRKEATYEV